jgi:hypothetical protein
MAAALVRAVVNYQKLTAPAVAVPVVTTNPVNHAGSPSATNRAAPVAR